VVFEFANNYQTFWVFVKSESKNQQVWLLQNPQRTTIKELSFFGWFFELFQKLRNMGTYHNWEFYFSGNNDSISEPVI
jgi:hypothetical protein